MAAALRLVSALVWKERGEEEEELILKAQMAPLILGPWSTHHPLRCARSWEQRGAISIPTAMHPHPRIIPAPRLPRHRLLSQRPLTNWD